MKNKSAVAVMEIKIQVTQDGKVGVMGFPKNVIDATRIMNAATNSVIEFFWNYAKDGNLDKNGTIIESKIIEAKKPIIRLDARQYMGPRPAGRKDGTYKR